MYRYILLTLACLALLLTGSAALAEPLKGTGLPVPRFVSLRADKVNMRSGPGVRYPKEWEFQRRGLPVEIIAEFDTWRKIRDYNNAEGWVHRAMLSSNRTVIIKDKVATLYADDSTASKEIARLEPGVIGAIKKCEKHWCRIELDDYKGWIERQYIWGIYKDEIID